MHVPKVFDRFEMKMMKDYHDLYLLVDVFEKFRNASLKSMDYAQIIIWVQKP